MKVKDYVRSWSNQAIHTEYLGVQADIRIKDTNCEIILEGDGDIKKVFRLIWELLFLYDGYFYEPISYEIDGTPRNYNELISVDFYKTDKKWYCSELLGRATRNLSPEVLEAYDKFRNTDMSTKKMTKSVVNAFYYLNSENYGKINVNHRLSLLLNIADGFVINTFRETNNVKASLDRFFQKTLDSQKLQQAISLLSINGTQYKALLAGERHAFDHYIYSENSISAFVYDSEEEIANYATWFFVYVLELVIRINFLKESGVLLDQDIIDYALDVIADWIIYENDLELDCKTDCYQLKQKFKRLGITIK